VTAQPFTISECVEAGLVTPPCPVAASRRRKLCVRPNSKPVVARTSDWSTAARRVATIHRETGQTRITAQCRRILLCSAGLPTDRLPPCLIVFRFSAKSSWFTAAFANIWSPVSILHPPPEWLDLRSLGGGAREPPAGAGAHLDTVLECLGDGRRNRRMESRLNPQARKPALRSADIPVGNGSDPHNRTMSAHTAVLSRFAHGLPAPMFNRFSLQPKIIVVSRRHRHERVRP